MNILLIINKVIIQLQAESRELLKFFCVDWLHQFRFFFSLDESSGTIHP